MRFRGGARAFSATRDLARERDSTRDADWSIRHERRALIRWAPRFLESENELPQSRTLTQAVLQSNWTGARTAHPRTKWSSVLIGQKHDERVRTWARIGEAWHVYRISFSLEFLSSLIFHSNNSNLEFQLYLLFWYSFIREIFRPRRVFFRLKKLN